MVPCRADDPRKRVLAQRRKGAEKKTRRRDEHWGHRAMRVLPLRLCVFARASSYRPSARASACRIATGFDIIARPHPSYGVTVQGRRKALTTPYTSTANFPLRSQLAACGGRSGRRAEAPPAHRTVLTGPYTAPDARVIHRSLSNRCGRFLSEPVVCPGTAMRRWFECALFTACSEPTVRTATASTTGVRGISGDLTSRAGSGLCCCVMLEGLSVQQRSGPWKSC